MNSIPRRHKETFHQVLYNLDDQVIVRNLVEDLMPEDVKAEIVRRFNADVDRYNAVVDRHQREDALKAAKEFSKGI